MTQKKTLGIIGGMGPAAGAYFMDLVIRMTQAQRDQEHLDVVLSSLSSIPDRTAYILDHRREDPLPAIVGCGLRLAGFGAEVLAVPCITAHYFYEELSRALPVPVIHAVRETALTLKNAGVRRVGIMATSGTLHACVFQKELERQGLEAVLPLAGGQKDVMDLIYRDIKAGLPADMDRFRRVSRELRENGAEVIILGCTELSIIKRDEDIGPGFIDTLDVLAKAAVECCGGQVRKEYDSLITR